MPSAPSRHRPAHSPAPPGRERARRLLRHPAAIPAGWIAGAALAAALTLALDGAWGDPGWIGEENARNLAATVAGALLTIVVLVFWVRLLAVQSSSNVFSARALRQFLTDTFQQHAMGGAIGGLAYAVVVLLALPDMGAGVESVPHLSVGLVGLWAIAVAVVVVVSVHNGARSSETAALVRQLTDATVERIRSTHPGHGEAGGDEHVERRAEAAPSGEPRTVTTTETGWVQHVNEDAILTALPAGATVQLETTPGQFSIEGTVLCRIWDADADRALGDVAADQIRRAVVVGQGPTLDQDIALGLRQLADVAQTALAPSVNDLTAANEALVHLAVILRELLIRDLPAATRTDNEGRRLLRPHELSFTDYVEQAFDQVRVAGATSPSVALWLYDVLGMLRDELVERELHDRIAALQPTAERLLASAEAHLTVSADLARVRAAARDSGLVEDAPATSG